jgi:hypothetical protein
VQPPQFIPLYLLIRIPITPALRFVIAAVSAAVVCSAIPTHLKAEEVAVKEYPDGTGVRILSPAPKPGVHPRIFFSPEDLPALREAATKSEACQIYYKQLQKIVADKLDAPGTPGDSEQ